MYSHFTCNLKCEVNVSCWIYIYNTIWSIFGEMDDIPKNKRNERSEEIGPHLDENDGFLFPFITFVWFIFWRPRSCYVTLFDGHSYRRIIFFFITFFVRYTLVSFYVTVFFLFKYTSLSNVWSTGLHSTFFMVFFNLLHF